MRRLVFAAVLALVITVSVAAREGRSQVVRLAEGQLLAWDGTPLANQTLLVEGAATPSQIWGWSLFEPEKFSRLVITDRNGYVQLVDMPAGTYTIKLVQPGAAKPVSVSSFLLARGYTRYDFSAKLDETPPQYRSRAVALGFDNPEVKLVNLSPRSSFETSNAFGAPVAVDLTYTILEIHKDYLLIRVDGHVGRAVFDDVRAAVPIKPGDLTPLNIISVPGLPKLYIAIIEKISPDKVVVAVGPKAGAS